MEKINTDDELVCQSPTHELHERQHKLVLVTINKT